MLTNSKISAFLFLLVVILIAFGCAGIGEKNCGSGPKAIMLKLILNADTDNGFDRALSNHGAVTQDELPCIVSATESWSPKKRQNGARLLVLVGGDADKILAIRKKIVLETEDVFVWAKVFDSLIKGVNANPAELAARRHDMIKKSLANADDFIQSVGLKAGVLGKYPGIEAEIRKRLESLDARLLQVALDALTPDLARTELPRLLKMMEEYETGKNYTHYLHKIYMFTPLLPALIRTEDPQAYLAVRTALEKDYKNFFLTGGTREEFSKFRGEANNNPETKKFCYYLIEENSILKPPAISILVYQTQSQTAKQEPTAELVKICLETIESGNLETADWRQHLQDKREQTECELFFKYLETGEDFQINEGKRKLGADAIEIGRQWLKDHQISK